MNKKLTVTEQEELFTTECKLINLKYEYQGYTGDENWAIVSELTEKELLEKYPYVIKRYMPFVLLSIEQGEVIAEANRNDHKHEERQNRHGSLFSIGDDDFDVRHPEAAVEYDLMEQIVIWEAINSLTEAQRKRIIRYFFNGFPYSKIAEEEGVSITSIKESIQAALKKMKKFF